MCFRSPDRQQENTLRMVAQREAILGHKARYFFTDNCKTDRVTVAKAFNRPVYQHGAMLASDDSTAEGLPVGNLKYFQRIKDGQPISAAVFLANTEAGANDAVTRIRSDIAARRQDSADAAVVLGLDAEWETEKPFECQSWVDLLQIATPRHVYLFHLSEMNHQIPNSLENLLCDDTLFFVGAHVKADVTRLTNMTAAVRQKSVSSLCPPSHLIEIANIRCTSPFPYTPKCQRSRHCSQLLAEELMRAKVFLELSVTGWWTFCLLSKTTCATTRLSISHTSFNTCMSWMTAQSIFNPSLETSAWTRITSLDKDNLHAILI